MIKNRQISKIRCQICRFTPGGSFLFLFGTLLFFIFSLCRLHDRSIKEYASTGIDQFFAIGMPYAPSMDDYLERDYFSKNTLKNGSFNKNTAYWISTADQIQGKQQISKNSFSLTNESYISPPFSLKIEAQNLPCSLYYSKADTNNPVKNSWDYRNESIWLGIKPGKYIELTFYYKGAAPTAYINLLKQNGDLGVLTTKMEYQPASSWKKMELSGIVPLGGRGISLAITINANQPERIMFLDEISVEVI